GQEHFLLRLRPCLPARPRTVDTPAIPFSKLNERDLDEEAALLAVGRAGRGAGAVAGDDRAGSRGTRRTGLCDPFSPGSRRPPRVQRGEWRHRQEGGVSPLLLASDPGFGSLELPLLGAVLLRLLPLEQRLRARELLRGRDRAGGRARRGRHLRLLHRRGA